MITIDNTKSEIKEKGGGARGAKEGMKIIRTNWYINGRQH